VTIPKASVDSTAGEAAAATSVGAPQKLLPAIHDAAQQTINSA